MHSSLEIKASKEEVELSSRIDCSSHTLIPTLLATIAPTLLPSKVKSGRVWRFTTHGGFFNNFGMIKGRWGSNTTPVLDALVAEGQFIGQGNLEILQSLWRIISSLGREDLMLLGGVLFWARCSRHLIFEKDGFSLKVMMPMVESMDPFLSIKKSMGDCSKPRDSKHASALAIVEVEAPPVVV